MPRLIAVTAMVLAFALPAPAAEELRLKADASSGRKLYTLVAVDVPLPKLAQAIAKEIGKKVETPKGVNSPITLLVVDAGEARLLDSVAAKAGLEIARAGEVIRMQVNEPTASLDVKNADVHDILASLKKQCGVRNLVVDPGVEGTGTFLFNDVPCSVAFKTVFNSLGLAGEFAPNSVASVKPRR